MYLPPSLRLRRAAVPGLSALVVGVVTSVVTPVRAATLWYNGDFNGTDASTNQSKVPVNNGGPYVLDTTLVYDNFVVPAGHTWTVSSVFTTDQVAYGATATAATWQIRSGVSAGNGGTLVSSGDTTATVTLQHAADFNNYQNPEYRVSATVSGLTLSAGTYWLAVAPDSTGYYGDQSYIETTSGANAIGTPPGNDGLSYVTESGLRTQTFNVADYLDYSAGVVGTDTIVAPEPTSALLLGMAAVPALARRRRRR